MSRKSAGSSGGRPSKSDSAGGGYTSGTFDSQAEEGRRPTFDSSELSDQDARHKSKFPPGKAPGSLQHYASGGRGDYADYDSVEEEEGDGETETYVSEEGDTFGSDDDGARERPSQRKSGTGRASQRKSGMTNEEAR